MTLPTEEELIYDKKMRCPVCDSEFTNKIMRTGKARSTKTDKDLRAVYDTIDPQKYTIHSCPSCGFTALDQFFKPMPPVIRKMVRESTCNGSDIVYSPGATYTYEESEARYELALKCCKAKRAKTSEVAYTMLRYAWLMRGWQEQLAKDGDPEGKISGLHEREEQYLQKALTGFKDALASENFPMAGMDENTVSFLIAVLEIRFGGYDDAAKLVSRILASYSASSRVKDKARELKEEILKHKEAAGEAEAAA